MNASKRDQFVLQIEENHIKPRSIICVCYHHYRDRDFIRNISSKRGACQWRIPGDVPNRPPALFNFNTQSFINRASGAAAAAGTSCARRLRQIPLGAGF